MGFYIKYIAGHFIHLHKLAQTCAYRYSIVQVKLVHPDWSCRIVWTMRVAQIQQRKGKGRIYKGEEREWE